MTPGIPSVLRLCPPDSLSVARTQAHRAVQFLADAARANVTVAPDDSQSSLTWVPARQELQTQPLVDRRGSCRAGVSFSPMVLCLRRDDEAISILDLTNVSLRDAATWFDEQLAEAGLATASGVGPPYVLPAEVTGVTLFGAPDRADTFTVLAGWFDLAHAMLTRFAAVNDSLTPGPGPVVCWPHHFDIATYVALDAGDPATARGVGVGMSPGDESYDQPYFYVNPWPRLTTHNLPALSTPGHWHTEGFVGAILTADELLAGPHVEATLQSFIEGAFATGRVALGT